MRYPILLLCLITLPAFGQRTSPAGPGRAEAEIPTPDPGPYTYPSIANYADLRGQPCEVDDTALVTDAQTGGVFICVSSDPYGNLDDSTLVFDIVGDGDWWSRDFAHTEGDPIQLDWWEGAVNNADVTEWFSSHAGVAIGQAGTIDLYVTAPTSAASGVDTLVSDYVDLTALENFYFNESDKAFVIKHDSLASGTDAHDGYSFGTMWHFEGINRVEVGGTNLNLTFKGGHPGLGTGLIQCGTGTPKAVQPCGSMTAGIIDIGSARSDAQMIKVRANFYDGYPSAVAAGWDDGAGQVDSLILGGLFSSAGFRANRLIEHIYLDSLIVTDPFGRDVGWDGTAYPDNAGNVGNMEKKIAVRAEMLGAKTVNGILTLRYGTAEAKPFASSTYTLAMGTAASPFKLYLSDRGVSGPRATELGLLAGVIFEQEAGGSMNTPTIESKTDGLYYYPNHSQALAKSYMEIIYPGDLYGNVHGNSYRGFTLEASSVNSGGDGCGTGGNCARVDSMTVYINAPRVSIIDSLLSLTHSGWALTERFVGRYHLTDEDYWDWIRDNTYSTSSWAPAIRPNDRYTVEGSGQWEKIHSANLTVGGGAFGVMDVINNGVIQNTTIDRYIHVDEDGEVTVSNVTFNGDNDRQTGALVAANRIMYIETGATVTVPAGQQLFAPIGEVIDGTGTLICNATEETLPYTFDGIGDDCELSHDYEALRAIAGPGTQELAPGPLAGTFTYTAVDPYGGGDDSTLVIAASGGGYWLRDTTATGYRSTDTPLELDWWENLSQGKEINFKIYEWADLFTPHWHWKVPTSSSAVDSVIWTRTAVTEKRFGATTTPQIRYATVAKGSDKDVVIFQPTPDTTAGSVLEWVEFDTLRFGGGGAGRVKFASSHRGVEPDDGTTTWATRNGFGFWFDVRAVWEENFGNPSDNSPSWTTAQLVEWDADCYYNWGNCLYLRGRASTGGSPDANQVDSLYLTGTTMGIGHEISAGAGAVHLDSLVGKDPYAITMGWDGVVAGTGNADYGNHDYGCKEDDRWMTRMTHGISVVYVPKITGVLYLQYGMPRMNAFLTDTLGVSSADPFKVYLADIGFSQSGVMVKQLQSVPTTKWDPDGINDATLRHQQFIFDRANTQYGWGTYGASISSGCHPDTDMTNAHAGHAWWLFKGNVDVASGGSEEDYSSNFGNQVYVADWPSADSIWSVNSGSVTQPMFFDGGSNSNDRCDADSCERTWGHTFHVAASDTALGVQISDSTVVKGADVNPPTSAVTFMTSYEGVYSTDAADFNYNVRQRCESRVDDILVTGTVVMSGQCQDWIWDNIKFTATGEFLEVQNDLSGGAMSGTFTNVRAPVGSCVNVSGGEALGTITINALTIDQDKEVSTVDGSGYITAFTNTACP